MVLQDLGGRGSALFVSSFSVFFLPLSRAFSLVGLLVALPLSFFVCFFVSPFYFCVGLFVICLVVIGRQGFRWQLTVSDPNADTIPATLLKTGTEASDEWTARSADGQFHKESKYGLWYRDDPGSFTECGTLATTSSMMAGDSSSKRFKNAHVQW